MKEEARNSGLMIITARSAAARAPSISGNHWSPTRIIFWSIHISSSVKDCLRPYRWVKILPTTVLSSWSLWL